MDFSKPKVTIDLDEYNFLLESKKEKERESQNGLTEEELSDCIIELAKLCLSAPPGNIVAVCEEFNRRVKPGYRCVLMPKLGKHEIRFTKQF